MEERDDPVALLPIHGKGQQYVPRHSTESVVAGIDNYQAAGHRRSRRIDGSAVRGLSVHGREFASCIEIPGHTSPGRRIGSQVTVQAP